jgi:hypothetical protein
MLGPTHLLVHAMLLFLSMVMLVIRPVAKFSPWHAYNPLERVLICVPIDVIADPPPPEGAFAIASCVDWPEGDGRGRDAHY